MHEIIQYMIMILIDWTLWIYQEIDDGPKVLTTFGFFCDWPTD